MLKKGGGHTWFHKVFYPVPVETQLHNGREQPNFTTHSLDSVAFSYDTGQRTNPHISVLVPVFPERRRNWRKGGALTVSLYNYRCIRSKSDLSVHSLLNDKEPRFWLRVCWVLKFQGLTPQTYAHTHRENNISADLVESSLAILSGMYVGYFLQSGKILKIQKIDKTNEKSRTNPEKSWKIMKITKTHENQ